MRGPSGVFGPAHIGRNVRENVASALRLWYAIRMHPLRLSIAKPCQEDWNSMAGSEKRRHCASCDHEVVALAELTPEDAAALVRSARPHSLCLRIEHDDDGTVIFRQNASRMNSTPLFMLTIGASMLVTACNEPAPTEAAHDIPKQGSTQSVDHVKPAATDSSSPAQTTNPPHNPTEMAIDSQALTAASAAANSQAAGNGDRAVKSLHKPTTRVTTGCVCAVGDKLCDCL